MMKELQIGDIVQLSPDVDNPAFAYCMMIVTEVKPWGAQGYVQALGKQLGQQRLAYYRVKWEEMEATGGKAVWVVE